MKISRKAKITAIIVIVLIVGIAIYIIAKKLKGAAPVTDSIKVDATKTTITDTQATLIAQQLLDAMNQYGTDEKAIIDALTPLNQNDLLSVIKKFGIKPYNGQALAEDWFSKNFASTNYDLAGWLRAELSGSDLATVQKIFTDNNVPF